MTKGTKRASPGAEEEKSPLQNVELSEEDAKKLEQISKAQARVELAIERDNLKRLHTVFENRRPILKSINNFWPVALLNHGMLPMFIQHNADQTALSYLEDIWVERDPKEHRCFTVEFHFKDNTFFSDKVLKKGYKYVPPPAAENDMPDEYGITESMVEFAWDRDTEPSATKINWKDAATALTKVYPRDADDDDDQPAESGSFFNFFEQGPDPYDIGSLIANEVFPEAIEYFLGKQGGDIDSDESDDDDDDDDAEEIDLEKPRTKKQRV